MKTNKNNPISRRDFIKKLGIGTASTAALMVMEPFSMMAKKQDGNTSVGDNKMTYRVNRRSGDKVSLLGFGMMRLPRNQEDVNQLVDYALAHGVNYFDTAPAYGRSEEATGIALKRHPRNQYYIATKMSNQRSFGFDECKRMYERSFERLQIDYIDYYLLHGCGMGGMDNLKARYLDNGLLHYCIGQRREGRIRNLGFSYHGDVAVFDYLLSIHDQVHWDFVQIELNYLDWDYANEINDRNTDARYLYAELQKRGIPAVIMEPLLGGRLANIPQYLMERMKQRDPDASIASWAFRYAGTPEGVLTVLSGMTYMEHLKDNLLTYCPLKPVTPEEENFLYDIAYHIVNVKLIPCNDCKYCMPCPYGVDIPSLFVHYNKVKSHDRLPEDAQDSEYARLRREFLVGQDRSVPRLRQAAHCIGCGQCKPHCPQNIDIPEELRKIDEFVENLRRNA